MIGLLLLTFVAAVNPPRLAGALLDERRRATVAGVGAVAALGTVVVLAGVARPLLDGLDVTPPTAHMAVGIVVAAAGLRDLVAPSLRPSGGLGGPASGLVPVAFPLLLQPQVGLLALVAGLDHGVVAATGAAAPAIAVGAWLVPRSTRPRTGSPMGAATTTRLAAARWLGAAAVVLGADLIWDGVLTI